MPLDPVPHSHRTTQFHLHSVLEHSPNASPFHYKPCRLWAQELVAGEHQNPSLSSRCLVMTWLPHHPLDNSCIAVRIFHHYPLAVSLWDGSLAICSLPPHGKTPSPSAVSPWEDSLTLRSLAIAMGWVPTGRLPMGKLPHYPLVTCCIAVLSLCLRKETPREENSVGRLSSHHRTLAYKAQSHFSNVQHYSRRYPSFSLEHMKRLWWSSTLECSLSRTGTVPLTGIAEAVASEASQVAYR